MFLVDKYAPKTIEDIKINRDIYDHLKIMSEDESIPHIIFYGQNGSGKKTAVRLFLEMLYDSTVNNAPEVSYQVSGSGNNVTEVLVKQSNYHIEIRPFNTNFDRYLVQEIIKEYAQRVPLNIFLTSRNFKTVVINNVDNLLYYAQMSLRRTMEKYSNTCRFVMWCESLSRVIEPLRSRCVCINIKSPSNDDMFEKIYKISVNENIKLSLDQYVHIINKARGNIRVALWCLDMIKYCDNDKTSYEKAINIILSIILKRNISDLLYVRELIYKIIRTNINGTIIIRDLMDKLCLLDVNIYKKAQITNIAAKYEYNLIKGRHEIFHIEAFVQNAMAIIDE